MTDKEKIIEYIDKLLEKYPKNYYLLTVAEFIDSMQKEPTGNPLGSTHTEFRTAVESLGISQEEHDAIVDKCLYGKEPELVDVDDLPKEETVSEDLEEACRNYADDEEYGDDVYFAIKAAFKDGAKWKEEQFEKNRLAACDRQTEKEAEIEQSFVMGIIENEHRQPTFDDAIKYGMRLQKEQLMASCTDVTVRVEAGNYPYIPQIELYDYDKDIPLAKEGDKYKVILIKED